MRAISSANPNRNGSWFTKESMERSIGTFVNKPILGYFKQGDFVSHNGEWKVDGETDLPYFDTWDTEGERILGIIRESDERKIIQGSDGLYWITFTCALWSQYNFKQVKRLIKDARRAKKNGGPAKNISVEVDILDYEMLENGVMKINEFELIGVTILGSRNGIKVEPGIENAELSVVDVMGRELYDRQVQALRLAYEKLDNSTEVKEEKNMEEVLNSTEEFEQNVATEEVVTDTSISETSDSSTENFEDTCSETEGASCECGTAAEADEACGEERTDECGGKCEEVCPDCGKAPCECEEKAVECGGRHEAVDAESCEAKETIREENSCEECEECEHAPMRDVAWLISSFDWQDGDIAECLEYYQNAPEEIENREYIINVLSRSLNSVRGILADLTNLAAVIAEGQVDDEKLTYESKLQQYPDHYALIKAYEKLDGEKAAIENELQSASEIIAKFEHAEFVASAKKLIASSKISSEIATEFTQKCESGEINSLDDLRVKVAMALLEQNMATAPEQVQEEETDGASEMSFSAPISTPDTNSVFTKKEDSKKASVSSWDRLRDYANR